MRVGVVLSLVVLAVSFNALAWAPKSKRKPAKADAGVSADAGTDGGTLAGGKLFEPSSMTPRLTLYTGIPTIEVVPGVKTVRVADPKLATITLLSDDEVEFRFHGVGETQIVYELKDGTRNEMILSIEPQP